MNINQVKYFAAAVERGSFSDAARELAVTTQAVSKSIAELEREVGCNLLVRDKSGVYPNQRGIQFYDKSRAALESFRDLERFPQRLPCQRARLADPYGPAAAGLERVLFPCERLCLHAFAAA